MDDSFTFDEEAIAYDEEVSNILDEESITVKEKVHQIIELEEETKSVDDFKFVNEGTKEKIKKLCVTFVKDRVTFSCDNSFI